MGTFIELKSIAIHKRSFVETEGGKKKKKMDSYKKNECTVKKRFLEIRNKYYVSLVNLDGKLARKINITFIATLLQLLEKNKTKTKYL